MEKFQFLFKRQFSIHFLILLIGITLYIFYFTTLSFLRHDNFYTGRYDLGNMDQTVWNTSRGRLFQMSSDDFGGISQISRLHAHADVILMFFAPLYWIWPDPKVLLLAQAVVLGLGALFVYLIARKVLKNNHASLILSYCYLLNPAIQHTNLYDFHAVTFGTTFLLAAFYFLFENKFKWFLIFGILAAITKEQVWMIVGLLSVYGFARHIHFSKNIFTVSFLKKQILSHKNWFIFSFFSFGIFFVLMWLIIPFFRGGEHLALKYYQDFGSSPTDIVKSIFLSPDKTFETVTGEAQKDYMRKLFSPLGYFSLLAPWYLIFAIPDLTISLLSKNDNLHQIYYQYSATVTPFLFIATIFGIRNFKTVFPKIPLLITCIFILYMAISRQYQFGPSLWSKKPNDAMIYKQRSNKERIHEELSKIPKNHVVAATNNIGAHLSQRMTIYTLPVGIEKADTVVFYLPDKKKPVKLVELLEIMKNNSNFQKKFDNGSLFIFERTGSVS